jgi:hypothetical protein
VAKSPGSALGEYIGKLIEEQIAAITKEVSGRYNFTARKRILKNAWGSRHSIDMVIEDDDNKPLILIEPKYLRYTKHNWDKGSRLIAGYYNLKKTYRSIRKSIAVLAGNWTDTSISFLRAFGVEIYRIPFSKISDVLSAYGVPFEWEEKDDITPNMSLKKFGKLKKKIKSRIGQEIVEDIRGDFAKSIETTLTLDPSEPRAIGEVEILIKTKQGEFYLSTFENVNQALEYLIRLQRDIPDLRTIIGEENP